MKKIAILNGLKMFAGFTGLFLIAHLLGLSTKYHLRILNGIIHLGFIYLALRQYRGAFPESNDNYLTGVAIGMYASAVGVSLFCVFMAIYLGIDEKFFTEIQSKVPMPEYFTPVSASILIFVEGIVVSLIGSYLIVRVMNANREASAGR